VFSRGILKVDFENRTTLSTEHREALRLCSEHTGRVFGQNLDRLAIVRQSDRMLFHARRARRASGIERAIAATA